jgi:uncharacterized protein (TIGR00106 family)
MLLAEISMWPMDKGESVGAYVARVLAVIDASGLPYKLGPLGTTIEGEWDEVMALITKCFRVLEADSQRVVCTVKMDYRKGHAGRIEGKVRSVERTLGRTLKT